MKKLVLFFFVFAIATTSMYAQKFSVAVNSGYTIGTGDASAATKFIPLGLQLRYGASDKLFLNLDYSHLMGSGDTKGDMDQILAGAGFVLSRKSSFKPYAGADLGISLLPSSESSFTLSPKVGFNCNFTSKLYLDVKVNYGLLLAYTNTSLLGFGVGIGYKL